VILSTGTNSCIARRLTITWTWLSLTKHVDPFLCCLHTSFELGARQELRASLDLSNILTGALATNAVCARPGTPRSSTKHARGSLARVPGDKRVHYDGAPARRSVCPTPTGVGRPCLLGARIPRNGDRRAILELT
jgi:hypothetical protein